MKPPNAPVKNENPSEPQTRKAYEKPQLQVYGDLAEITKAVTGTKNNDGASHPNRHFTS